MYQVEKENMIRENERREIIFQLKKKNLELDVQLKELQLKIEKRKWGE